MISVLHNEHNTIEIKSLTATIILQRKSKFKINFTSMPFEISIPLSIFSFFFLPSIMIMTNVLTASQKNVSGTVCK